MQKLTPRLAAVAALVRPGRPLADIGTDHAYLPVALVAAGHTPWAVASDIGEGPADSARRTVAAAGLGDRIPVRVGDGLTSIAPGEVEEIVIAGMGGETIAAILAAAPWVAAEGYHLVLQPMSKPEKLRRYLLETGFSILREQVVAEGERLYVVMAVTFTNQRQIPEEADCVIGHVPHTPEGQAYLKKQGGRISEHLKSLPETPEYDKQRTELQALVAAIDRWMTRE